MSLVSYSLYYKKNMVDCFIHFTNAKLCFNVTYAVSKYRCLPDSDYNLPPTPPPNEHLSQLWLNIAPLDDTREMCMFCGDGLYMANHFSDE